MPIFFVTHLLTCVLKHTEFLILCFKFLLYKKYKPTAKGYFSGCGGMETWIMQAGINSIQSLDLDIEATNCMKVNSHYFSHNILTADIKDKTVLEQRRQTLS